MKERETEEVLLVHEALERAPRGYEKREGRASEREGEKIEREREREKEVKRVFSRAVLIGSRIDRSGTGRG